jgi:hypothetical protein
MNKQLSVPDEHCHLRHVTAIIKLVIWLSVPTIQARGDPHADMAMVQTLDDLRATARKGA